jgi:hypothetical protein
LKRSVAALALAFDPAGAWLSRVVTVTDYLHHFGLAGQRSKPLCLGVFVLECSYGISSSFCYHYGFVGGILAANDEALG